MSFDGGGQGRTAPGHKSFGNAVGKCRFTASEAIAVLRLRSQGLTCEQLAQYFGAEVTVVRDLVAGRSYRHLEEVNLVRDELGFDGAQRITRAEKMRIRASELRALLSLRGRESLVK